MKACFFLQRRFAYAGHVMALTFHKKYGIKDFCGYVNTRASFEFLKSQQDIKYTNLLLGEDLFKKYKEEKLDFNFLKNLEKDYGLPNLWPCIELDRLVRYNLLLREYPHDTSKYSHEEMMKIVQVKARVIIKFLEEEKPDFVIFSAIGSIGGLLLYRIAQKKGIKTFLFRTSRIGIRYSLTEDYNVMSYIEKAFEEIQKNRAPYQNYIEQAEKYLREFRDRPVAPYGINFLKAKPPTRQRQFKFLLPQNLLKSAGWFAKMLWAYFSDKNRDDYSTPKPWHYLLDKSKRKMRVLFGFGDLYDEADLNEDFAFFPLHYEPEIATLLYAPFYIDQLWLIRQIARSLPLHYKLYVKEHPEMFGYRPRRYYKELKKIPNVRLVKPGVSSFDLTRNTKLVITLSSSAGWEALLFKKPVITFGNGFYRGIPMVKRCRIPEDLPQIVKDQLENFHYDEEALINFIAAIYRESVELNLPRLWDVDGGGEMDKKEREFVPLVDLIAEKLGLKTAK